MRIHLAGEHALELQLFHALFVAIDIGNDRVGGVFVILGFDQLQQLAGSCKAVGERADAVDRLVEQGALAAQRLRPLRIVPDVGVFQLAFYFFQAFALGVVVKGTPSAHPAARSGRRCAGARD
jgi:hypothetical protein